MRRLRLRTVLASVFLLILALPLTGFLALRVYESALVRQTESELIGQAAMLSAAYATLFGRLAGPNFDYAHYGLALPPRPIPARSLFGESAYATQPAEDAASEFDPRPAKLDLARHAVGAPPADPVPSSAPADALAVQVGRDLTPVLQQTKRVTLAGLRVIAPNGVMVASTGDDLGLSLGHQPEVARALRGEFSTLLRAKTPSGESPAGGASISRTTALRVVVAMPIRSNERVIGAVLLMRTPANLVQVVWARRVKLGLLGLALLLATIALAWLTATTITQPLQRLAAQAQRARNGERGAVQPARRRVVREVAELSDTVAGMAGALEARADYIKDFAAHVSHEFKTPLTAIGGAAELLREHGESMAPDERSRFLNIISHDTERLSRLTRRLLELARADMAGASDEQCSVLPVLKAAAARSTALGQMVTLAMPIDAALSVPMTAEMLDSILSGLLDNARQHAPGASVQLSVQADDAVMSLLVRDDGPGISAANASKIFEPFFTTARSTGNTGMGLAIIRALLHAQGCTIALHHAPKGSCFVLSWPRP